MSLKIGSVTPSKLYLGSTEILKAYLGGNLVWDNGGVDPDAQAFITAASITDSTQQAAINTLVTGLKADGIWSKMKAVYPMVGGTASSHKYNLIDPQDTDGAFRLDFNGGWTHSANGALPNGSNAYADTHFIENNELSINDEHISAYLRTNINGVNVSTLYCDIGTFSSSTVTTNMFVRHGGKAYFRVQDSEAGPAASSTDSRGFWVANRVSSSETRNRRNSTLITQTRSANGLSQVPFYIGAARGNNSNPNTTSYYSKRETAFNTIGEGLTDTESSNLYTRVQAFQTSLSRNV